MKILAYYGMQARIKADMCCRLFSRIIAYGIICTNNNEDYICTIKLCSNHFFTAGADLAGIGDLSALPQEGRYGMRFGIAVAVKYPQAVIRGIENGPTRDYFDHYHALNQKLDKLVTLGARLLTDAGYNAIAQTLSFVQYQQDDFVSALPHKTVATRAGLGWIGKCALLVTPQFGSAVRISSIVTDAPLEASAPVNVSECGACTLCTCACPAGAVSGKLWQPGIKREALYDALGCYKAARALSGRLLGEEITLCGKCIVVCPYTKRYLDALTGDQRI